MTTARASRQRFMDRFAAVARTGIVWIFALTGAGCGGEGLNPALELEEPAGATAQSHQALSGGNSYWHQAAYFLTDDDDNGLRQYTDALIARFNALEYFTTRIHRDAYNAVMNDVQSKNLILSKVVIVANGHGGSSYALDGVLTDAADWRTHTIGIGKSPNRQTITTQLLADLAQDLRALGKQVVILDNSCSGGATVKYVESLIPNDSGVCTISTTGTMTPGAAGQPPYQDVLGDGVHDDFKDLGLWSSALLVGYTHGTSGMEPNHRFHQYGYMNGCSETMTLRESMSAARGSLSTWDYWNRLRHHHVYLRPDRYYDGTATNAGASNYGPAPDSAAAEGGFKKYGERKLQEVEAAATLFALKHSYKQNTPLAQNVRHVYDTVRTDVKEALRRWRDAFFWADLVAQHHKVCGQSLAERVRTILWNTPCAGPNVVAIPTGCSATDSANLSKYHTLGCQDPSKVVPAVLADYPLIGDAIAKVQDAEQAVADTLIDVSTFVYEQIEPSLCVASGCRAIRVGP